MADWALLTFWPSFCINADIDECLTDNGGCETLCVNTAGSFQCSCDAGYILAPDNFTCDGTPTNLWVWLQGTAVIFDLFFQDLDECAINHGMCEQRCVNTEGSFRCGCRPGHVLAPNNMTCFQPGKEVNEFSDPHPRVFVPESPLTVMLINSSPRTSRNITFVDFVPSKVLTSATCDVPGSVETTVDCKKPRSH